MRNRVLTIFGALLLVFTVACASISPIMWGSLAYASEVPTDDSGIMIVFYKIVGDDYLWWCDLTADIIDNGDGSWDVYSPQVVAKGVKQAYVDYGYYKYEPIPHGYNGTVTDLGLVPPTADDLPHSQHIGKLVNVDVNEDYPATVRRKWRGMVFDIQCLVSDTAVALWQADRLNVGDYVIVSFIDEIIDSEELNLAIVVDKVYDSWS